MNGSVKKYKRALASLIREVKEFELQCSMRENPLQEEEVMDLMLATSRSLTVVMDSINHIKQEAHDARQKRTPIAVPVLGNTGMYHGLLRNSVLDRRGDKKH